LHELWLPAETTRFHKLAVHFNNNLDEVLEIECRLERDLGTLRSFYLMGSCHKIFPEHLPGAQEEDPKKDSPGSWEEGKVE
jgi:hypothetical protein